MTDAPRYTNLRDYLRVIRQHRLLIVVVALVFTAAAFGLTARGTPVYQAQASVQLNDPNQYAGLIGNALAPSETSDTRATVLASVATRPSTITAVKSQLHSSLPVAILRGKLSAQYQGSTGLVQLTAVDTNAQFAAALANAFANQVVVVSTSAQRALLSSAANRLAKRDKSVPNNPASQLTRTLDADQVARLRVLADIAQPAQLGQPASVPGTPISPRPVRNTLLGLVLGLALGLLAAFVRDSLDRRLRSSREIQEHLKMPLLGLVRHDALGHAGFVNNGKSAPKGEIEAFRIMRTNLEFLEVDEPLRSVVVTSGLPEEGKSTVAAALAWVSAMAGKSTLLVECDLRRPSLAERLGIKQSPGLSEYLAGKAEPADVVQTVAVGESGGNGDAPPAPAVAAITAGASAPRPAELLGSKRFSQFLAEVRMAYDFVVLDSAPLLAVSDTLELLALVDGVVVCVRASRVTRDQARAARAALDHLPAKPAGLVVTDVRGREVEDYGYYSYAYTSKE